MSSWSAQFLLLLSLLAGALAPRLAAAETVALGPALDGVAPQMWVLEDPERRLTIDDVTHEPWRSRFRPLPADRSSAGISRSAWWVRFEVANGDKAPAAWVTELANPFIDYVDAYQVTPAGVAARYQLGDYRPMAARPVPGVLIAMPFVTGPGESDQLYMRFAANEVALLDFGQALWSPARFTAHQQLLTMLMGLVLGTAIAMLIYNFVLFLLIRVAEYFWYLFYGMSIVVLFITNSGVGLRYLWPDDLLLADAMPILAALMTFSFGILFTRAFLDTRHWTPRADRLLHGLLLLNLLALLCYGLHLRGVALALVLIIGLSFALFPIIGIMVWRQGHRYARSYTLAWTVWSIATVAVVLRIVGVLPNYAELVWAIRIGFISEGMLLALALADRINVLKLEKSAAENEQHRVLARAKEELELKVAERTAELEAANRTAEALARTDQLTGLANRRAFFEHAERELRRSLRYHQPLSLIMFDIDYFKAINDTYGHAIGDEVIRRLATVAAATLRDTDMVARIGGEEFAVILPQTPAEGAMRLAERLRADFDSEAIAAREAELHVTASFGVATIGATKENLDEIMARADAALYEAKHRGRNQVVAGS